jgi:hypothetical protein
LILTNFEKHIPSLTTISIAFFMMVFELYTIASHRPFAKNQLFYKNKNVNKTGSFLKEYKFIYIK